MQLLYIMVRNSNAVTGNLFIKKFEIPSVPDDFLLFNRLTMSMTKFNYVYDKISFSKEINELSKE